MRAGRVAWIARASIALSYFLLIFVGKAAVAQPLFDCHQWFPFGYTHAWEVGQAVGGGDNNDTERALFVGEAAQGTSSNSNTAAASMTYTSTCTLINPATAPQLDVQLMVHGHIETHMHPNDEAGVVWSPKWIGFVNLPGGLPTSAGQQYTISVTVTYLSYTPSRTCTLQLDNNPPDPVYVYIPNQQSRVTRAFTTGVGGHEINFVCFPEYAPTAYFLWDMGDNINENRDETVDILVSVGLASRHHPARCQRTRCRWS